MSGLDRFLEIISILPDIEDSPDVMEAGRIKGASPSGMSPSVMKRRCRICFPMRTWKCPRKIYCADRASGVGKTTLCSL